MNLQVIALAAPDILQSQTVITDSTYIRPIALKEFLHFIEFSRKVLLHRPHNLHRGHYAN